MIGVIDFIKKAAALAAFTLLAVIAGYGWEIAPTWATMSLHLICVSFLAAGFLKLFAIVPVQTALRARRTREIENPEPDDK